MKQFTELEPEYKDGLYLLGIFYFKNRELNKAEETFMKGFESDKVEERLDSYYWLIIVNIKQNNIESAKEFYRKTIEIDPKFIEECGWADIDLNKEEIRRILTTED